MNTKAECHAPQEICTHKWMNGCITRYWICEHLTIKRAIDESQQKPECHDKNCEGYYDLYKCKEKQEKDICMIFKTKETVKP